MGLKAIPLADMKTYVERVQGLLGGETIRWDFEGQDRRIRFLNPELGLINLEDPVELHISAMGPKARRLVADMGAGWLNFGADHDALARNVDDMKGAWQAAGREAASLHSTLFFLGAVLDGNDEGDREKLMTQAAPWTAVMFHNMLDEAAPIPSRLPAPIASVLDRYRALHAAYEPADARYLQNHRGHLMFLRDEEKALITPELVRATTLSGSVDELVERLRALAEAGYQQFAIQLVPGHESALEDWAAVFERV